VLVGANVGVQRDFDHREQVAAVRADRLSPGTCLGPAALAPGNGCGSVGGEGPSTVAPEVVAAEGSQPIFQRCLQVHGADLKTCHLGTRLQPKRTVALVGDSHAGALLPVMDEIGKQLQWDVIASTKGSCPATTARRVLPDETGDDKQVSCEQFNAAASRQILDNPKISDVFVASMTSRYRWDSVPGGTSLDNPGIAGFQTTWKAWTAAGKRVHVVRDVPTTDNKRIPMCLALATGATGTCDTSRATALPEDLAVTAALSLRSPLVEVIDLTSQFCSRTTCYAQVGNVMVYRDTSHLSVEYSRLLAPAIIAQLGRSAGSPDTGAGARRG
jgi:hypothetical protein